MHESTVRVQGTSDVLKVFALGFSKRHNVCKRFLLVKASLLRTERLQDEEVLVKHTL